MTGNQFTFVLSETPPPVSLDPLEADYSNNLHASQMVHRTLLDVDDHNTLTSSVLKAFSYTPEKAEIRFEVRDSEQFSDGSKIGPKDIEMTIKRMAARRPEFPVLRHIRGVREWAGQPNALSRSLPGVVVEDNTVRILFDRDINDPLFRFALPLFGVVKHECVDTASNRLKEDCPTSGFYKLKSADQDSRLFALTQPGRPLPPELRIQYRPHTLEDADFADMDSGNHVILTQEYGLESAANKFGFVRVEQPNSRFSMILLNPNSPPFETPLARRFFADILRSNMRSGQKDVQNESSLFSRLLPGYMSPEELQHAVGSISEGDAKGIRAALKGKQIRWMRAPNNNNFIFEAVLQKTLNDLGMTLQTVPDSGTSERFDGFASRDYNLLLSGSGFWAFDPVGDVQMLFTRGLHEPLKFVAEDDHLQTLLRDLEFEADPNERLRAVNTYLYRQGLLNVYTHSKRVYLVKGKNLSASIPIAITPPAPWQLFPLL